MPSVILAITEDEQVLQHVPQDLGINTSKLRDKPHNLGIPLLHLRVHMKSFQSNKGILTGNLK